MKLRKSIFSYIIWVIFAVTCYVSVLASLDDAGILTEMGLDYPVVIGVVCAALLLSTAVFAALRVISTAIGPHIADLKMAERIFSILLPVLILMGVALRLAFYLLYYAPIDLGDDTFYRQAYVVSDSAVLPFQPHGASQAYLFLLHVLFLVFGNTPFAGVVLQIVLFFLCLLFIFLSMDLLCGKVPAAVSMAAVGLLPVSLQYIFSLTPELFYLFFYLLGLYLLAVLKRKWEQGRLTGLVKCIPVFFLGLVIGFLLYLDLFSASLFGFAAVVFSLAEGKKEKGRAFLFSALIWLGAALGLCLCALCVDLTGQAAFTEFFREIFAYYFSAPAFAPVWIFPDTTLAGTLLLLFLSFFTVPAFLLWKKMQSSAFVLSLLFAYGLSLFSISHTDYRIVLTFLWSALAGIGLYGTLRVSQEDEEEEMMEEEMMEEEMMEEEEEAAAPDGGRQNAKAQEQQEGWDVAAGDKSLETLEHTLEDQEEEPEYAAKEKERTEPIEKAGPKKEKPAPGKPLPNPLPVPKKTKRGRTDFAYQIEEEKMRFDIDTPKEDDFDY